MIHYKLQFCNLCEKFNTASYLPDGYGCLCADNEYTKVDVGLSNVFIDVNNYIEDYYIFRKIAKPGDLFAIGGSR